MAAHISRDIKKVRLFPTGTWRNNNVIISPKRPVPAGLVQLSDSPYCHYVYILNIVEICIVTFQYVCILS